METFSRINIHNLAMLNHTSELAVRLMLLLGLEAEGTRVTPREVAPRLDCSESYLAKVMGRLVQARLLDSR
ncbi:MAG: Rrf2 family transcriptional regulator, partial [Thermoanaerobaculia bacterium]|nr:Rrf2 family transcriptional regulator [Thermoanaerobaculia bacterium]